MYNEDTLEMLQSQLHQAMDFNLYTDLPEINSWEEFREISFTTEADLVSDYEKHAPDGSLHDSSAMMCFTPLEDDIAPVFDTADDLEAQAEVNAVVFERAGIESGDRVMNTFGYHTFGTGIIIQRGLETLGAEVIPAGPGESDITASNVENYDVDCLLGNPSFALKVGQAGASVDVFVGAGEPFTSVPGLRDQVKDALNADIAVDYFGNRQILPVAVETSQENGLIVNDEYVVVEIIDPDTTEVLPFGERGELVVTHLRKEACPLVRYRTGDLATWEQRDDEIVLPNGVIGRTDNRIKVKGVKVYPESLRTVLAGFDGLTGEYRLEVSRPESTDHIRLDVEGEADIEKLRSAVAERLLVTPDELNITDELEKTEVTDDRY